MKIRAEMGRQRAPLCPHDHQVDKVVEITNAQFAALLMRPLDRYGFIKDNEVEAHQGDGVNHCLLILGEGHEDGVLVKCGNGGCADHTAYVAGARDIVQARLNRVTDFIVSQGTQRTASGSWFVYCEELDEKFGVVIQEGNGLDIMLKDTLERRPEVAQTEVALQHIETVFHPEFCRQLCGGSEEEKTGIRVRDILPLLTDCGLTFLTHEEADTSVLAQNLRELTPTGREDYAALLNARVAEISPSLEGTEIVLTDMDPEELARFNEAYDAFEEAEQAMGDMTP